MLRGDLATEQRTNSCERRQQAGCVGGNFFSLLYIIDWKKYAQCLCCMLCCVVCCALPPGCTVGLISSQHEVSLPASSALLHGWSAVVSHAGDDFNLVTECQTEKKKLEAGTHGWRVKRKLDSVKRVLITICSSVGCSHEVRQSSHHNKYFQSRGYVEYFSVKQTELKEEELHFE